MIRLIVETKRGRKGSRGFESREVAINWLRENHVHIRSASLVESVIVETVVNETVVNEIFGFGKKEQAPANYPLHQDQINAGMKALQSNTPFFRNLVREYLTRVRTNDFTLDNFKAFITKNAGENVSINPQKVSTYFAQIKKAIDNSDHEHKVQGVHHQAMADYQRQASGNHAFA